MTAIAMGSILHVDLERRLSHSQSSSVAEYSVLFRSVIHIAEYFLPYSSIDLYSWA